MKNQYYRKPKEMETFEILIRRKQYHISYGGRYLYEDCFTIVTNISQLFFFQKCTDGGLHGEIKNNAKSLKSSKLFIK